MAYTWSKELETGNGLIDTQHMQLIRAVNDMLEACAEGRGRAELERTLTFLQEYTVKHFADEEELQRKYRYPDYYTHRLSHEDFKKVVAELAEQLRQEGPTVVLVGKLNKSVGDWLVQHIKREDIKIAAHIRSVSK